MIKVVWPEYISLTDWAGALAHDFYNENIIKLENEEDWRQWAAIIAGTGAFEAAGVPAPSLVPREGVPHSFSTWQEWAKVVYNIMSNERT